VWRVAENRREHKFGQRFQPSDFKSQIPGAFLDFEYPIPYNSVAFPNPSDHLLT